MASIYDIAKVAGVSYSTVSLILNNRGDDVRISKKTQERVKKIAKDMGYVPNIHARKLISKDIANFPEIALLWSPSQHPIFLNSMIGKMNELVKLEKIQPMSVTIYPFENNQIEKLEKVLTGNFAHGIIVPIAGERDIKYLKEIDIQTPTVTIYNNTSKYHSVDVDSHLNGRRVAEVFYKLGLRRVAMIQNIYFSTASRKRMKGFKAYCLEHGMEIVAQPDKRQNKDMNINTAMERYKKGRMLTEKMLASGCRPEGIFVQDDDSARGVIHALHAQGFRIPEDVSVICYGYNSKENEEENQLTLIGYPMEELTEKTWMLMNDILAGKVEKTKTKRILCTAPFYFGKSCQRPEDFDWNDDKK